MNKRLSLVFLLCMWMSFVNAQTPCSTVLSPEMKSWLNYYASHRDQFQHHADVRTIYYIPLKIHLVGKTNGTGFYRLDNLWKIICELNEKYADVGFYFYLYDGIDFIKNDAYYSYADYSVGDQMMGIYNVAGAANVYFVGQPGTGNCGYYTYGEDAVAIGIACANTGSTTVAHELGHYFSLPHPFDLVNGIIEYVDGSNCTFGGDAICDTRADYLDYRWGCPYSGNKMDPHGDLYHPDSSLYMSYSDDHCQSRFSADQMNIMVNYLVSNRSYLLNHTVPSSGAVADSVTYVYPIDNSKIDGNDVTFQWNAVPNASFYNLQITYWPNYFIPVQYDVIVSGTSYTAQLTPNKSYHWRVFGISNGNTCVSGVRSAPFNTTLSTGIQVITSPSTDFQVAPTISMAGSAINLTLTALAESHSLLRFIAMDGRVIKELPVNIYHGENNWSLSTDGLANGMYLLNVVSDGKLYEQKIIIGK